MIVKGLIFIWSIVLVLGAGFVNFREAKHQIESQYVPISKRYPGLDLPAANPSVTVQFAYDATCGTTVQFDKNIRQVIDTLANSHPDKFSYRYALQVLPYHISSFKITQAIRYVNGQKGAAEGLRVLRHFFDTNQVWGEQGVANMQLSAMMDKIASEVAQLTGLLEEDIRRQISHFSDTDYETRKWAKYAMGTLHVSGTPMMFVNGARVDGATGMTVGQLVKLLTDLL